MRSQCVVGHFRTEYFAVSLKSCVSSVSLGNFRRNIFAVQAQYFVYWFFCLLVFLTNQTDVRWFPKNTTHGNYLSVTSNIAKVFVFHIDALSLWTLDCTLTQVTRPRVHIFILERILSNGERHLVVGHRCRMSGVKLRLDFCGRQWWRIEEGECTACSNFELLSFNFYQVFLNAHLVGTCNFGRTSRCHRLRDGCRRFRVHPFPKLLWRIDPANRLRQNPNIPLINEMSLWRIAPATRLPRKPNHLLQACAGGVLACFHSVQAGAGLVGNTDSSSASTLHMTSFMRKILWSPTFIWLINDTFCVLHRGIKTHPNLYVGKKNRSGTTLQGAVPAGVVVTVDSKVYTSW